VAIRQGIDANVILQAAAQLADRDGIEQVTLAALAAQLNIKTPSLYNHIAGLPGLRKQLTLHGLQLLKESIMHATLGKSGDDAIFAAGIAYVSFARRHPGLYEATTVAPDKTDSDIQSAADDFVRMLLRILDAYKLDEKEALHTVRAIRSMVHGFATLEARGGFAMQLDRDESLHHLLNTYLSGMRHKGK
jgi:AcrR family transcriptional regulator